VEPKDFVKGNLGVRVYDKYCIVIEKKRGVDGWVEDGHRYLLPLSEGIR
jgi:hypothetical protein